MIDVAPQTDEQARRANGWRRAITLLVSLFLAIGGQWILLVEAAPVWPALASFAVAIVLFIHVLAGWPGAQLGLTHVADQTFFRPLVRVRSWRAILVLGSFILAIVSYFRFAGNNFSPGWWPWIAAIVLFAIAFVQRPVHRAGEEPAAARRQINWTTILILSAIVLLALFFRVYRLDAIPIDMTSDHAEKLLDVQDVLDGLRPIYFPRNTGREALQFYWTAFLVHYTPLTVGHLALKAGTAVFGLLAIPFTYLLGKELYGRQAGFLASFFLAISHWHVAITRIGLRFPFTAAFATPALFFLLRALRNNRRNDWLAASLFLGVGLHTYTAMRIVPALFLALIGLKLLVDLVRRRRNPDQLPGTALTAPFWQNAVAGGLLTLLLVVPLIRFAVDDPGMFWLRALSRAQEGTAPDLTSQASVFAGNVKNAMLMFNYEGDVVPANTIPGSPVLGLVSGGLFVLAGAYLVWRLLLGRDVRSLYVLVILFFLLLPSILSLAFPHENPSVVRTGGAIPVVMIMVALPFLLAWRLLRELPDPAGTLLATAMIFCLTLVAIADNYNWYFNAYDFQYRRTMWNATEMAATFSSYVEEGVPVENVYHIPYPHWVDTRNIGISAGYGRWNNALVDTSELREHGRDRAAKLYFVHPSHNEALSALATFFPEGRYELHPSEREGKQYVTYYVPER